MNYKRLIAWTVACVAITVFSYPHTAQAQTKVAIIDVGLVFKSHPQFTQQLAALKQEADQFKAASIQAQQTLVQKAESIKRFTPGSPDYKAAESKLAQESAAMEVEQRNKMRSMMEMEAKLHYQTYQQINEMISNYCVAKNIQLVLRYNGAQMDPKKPGTVMQRVNSSIVYHAPSRDITRAIITQLGGQVGTANAGSPVRR